MSSPSAPTALTEALARGLFQERNQDLLRAIIDNLSEGVLIANASGEIIYRSPSALRFQGIGDEGARPDNWTQRFGIFHPDTRAPFAHARLPMFRALKGEASPTETLYIHAPAFPEGQYVRASARPVRDGGGALLGALLFLRDVTREWQAEAEQRLSEGRFRLIVEAVQEGIWMIGADHHTQYVNRGMAQMLGYTVDEMLGQPVLTFIPEDHRARVTQNLQQRRQDIAQVHELALLHKQGHRVWTLMSSNPILDEHGRYCGALAAVTDITPRREAEHQVRRLNEELERRIAERTAQLEFSNRELEAFAYSVAHDLRAPLRSISNFTVTLTEDCAGQLDATGQDYLQRIRASAQRMGALIDGILALSRVNRTEFQQTRVDLSALARSVAEQLQRWQPARFVRFQLQDGLVCQGDAQLLRSVMENLLGNAWKFSRERPVAEIAFGVLPDSSSGRVYFVRDNGAGFDTAYQSKLFGVFQRLHTQQEFEGTGVGLATVQRIIRRHGGRVWAEGHVGQGATFFFTLHDASPA